jgi:transposase
MAQRKKHTAELKAKVAIEALKEAKTANQIASKYQVHASQVTQWKKAAKDILVSGFGESKKTKPKENEAFSSGELFEQIGRLKVELDWLKKKSEL